MQKTNIDGTFIELEVKKRKRKTIVKPIIKSIVGKHCSFVGRNERYPGRIVSFTGNITKDLGEEVECEMVDNYIYVPNTLFKIILSRKSIRLK